MHQAAMGSFRFCVGLFVKCDLVWMIKWRNFSHDSHPTQTGSFYEWNLWVWRRGALLRNWRMRMLFVHEVFISEKLGEWSVWIIGSLIYKYLQDLSSNDFASKIKKITSQRMLTMTCQILSKDFNDCMWQQRRKCSHMGIFRVFR